MKFKIALFFLGLLFTNGLVAKAETGFINQGSLQVHYGVYPPQNQAVVGDVLFLHGYGDTFENHHPLFQEWNRIGLRVIAFDYPSHGKTKGGGWDDLDWHSFESLAVMAQRVREKTQEDSSRPLFLAGWSTGGLLALRIAQSEDLKRLFPSIQGMVLYAPGVAVKKCVGNLICHITNDTLTHDEKLQERSIRPRSPVYRVNFAVKLLYNAHMTWKQKLPSEIPTLVFVAGDEEDRYVPSPELKKWVSHQRTNFSASITAYQCPEARHELDNESLLFGGPQVRLLSALFVNSLIQNREMESASGPCVPY